MRFSKFLIFGLLLTASLLLLLPGTVHAQCPLDCVGDPNALCRPECYGPDPSCSAGNDSCLSLMCLAGPADGEIGCIPACPVCQGCPGACAPAPIDHCTNSVQDADETGVDCGGADCPPCAPPPAHCTNGVQDADETGVDCGGADCPACAGPTGNVCTNPIIPCGQVEVNPATGESYIPNPCQLCDVFVLLINLVNFVMQCLVPPIALIMLVIGALFIMFSGGNPALQNRAKSIIRSVIIGLFIVYGSWLLISTFLTMIGVENWTGLATWFQPTICP